MKKIILGIFLGTLVLTLPSPILALNRNAYVAGARANTIVSNVFNTNVVVVNLSANGSVTSGNPITPQAAQTIADAYARIQLLKEQLRK